MAAAAGDLVTFGSGESGRLGHGSETNVLRPRKLALDIVFDASI